MTKSTKGAVWYTDNELDEKIMLACQQQLAKKYRSREQSVLTTQHLNQFGTKRILTAQKISTQRTSLIVQSFRTMYSVMQVPTYQQTYSQVQAHNQVTQNLMVKFLAVSNTTAMCTSPSNHSLHQRTNLTQRNKFVQLAQLNGKKMLQSTPVTLLTTC